MEFREENILLYDTDVKTNGNNRRVCELVIELF